jgi:hypothetical protein
MTTAPHRSIRLKAFRLFDQRKYRVGTTCPFSLLSFVKNSTSLPVTFTKRRWAIGGRLT